MKKKQKIKNLLEKEQNRVNIINHARGLGFTENYPYRYVEKYNLRITSGNLLKYHCYLDKENWLYDIDPTVTRCDVQPCVIMDRLDEIYFICGVDKDTIDSAILNCLILARNVAAVI